MNLSQEKNTLNILIIRTDRIGDVVLTLPVASVLKKHFPDCKVTFLLREYTKSIVENNPFVDEVIIAKEKNGKLILNENIAIIKQKKFDVCLVVSPTLRIALISYLSGIKTRIGTGFRYYSFFFNRKVFEHRKYGEKHELEFNINMLSCLGINEQISEQNVEYKIHINPFSSQAVEGYIATAKKNTGNPIAIIHPGSGGSAVDLPQERMKQLAVNLAQQLKINLIVTGSEAEKTICEEIANAAGGLNLAGKLNLSELIALINECSMMAANSTGPIHLAAALGKYAVGFYPKIPACSPMRWGPYTTKKSIFTPDTGCGNCTRKQCERLNCMDSINIQAVTDEIKKVMKI